jgi:D-alanyl-D-alanine carboxypeptidase/D-alanyl-D-alanine-endopeptidase (penicillin-binding protein 4)
MLLIVLPIACAHAAAATPPSLALAARDILGADQGVYVETSDGTVLLAQHAEHAVHPASVSKVPTTLALLRALGPDYRFQTTFVAEGQLVGQQLHGNLTVQSDADPALVDEDALLVAERFNLLGIRTIAGRLRVQGALTFDWQNDPQGAHLARALSGDTPSAAWQAVLALHPHSAGANASTTPTAPSLQFRSAEESSAQSPSRAIAAGVPATRRVLILRSEPLLPMLKALDDYSNNIVAPLAQVAGGAAAVQGVARDAVPAQMRAEIVLGDGAGTDPRNRLSPRVAVKLLRALESQLASTGHALPDVLPVSGVDTGTLRDRLNGPQEIGRVVGKTGTYGDYGASALVGAIRTSNQGTVYFAILNHGVAVPEARRRQDAFVRALLAHLRSLPWSHAATSEPAIARTQLELAP